MIPVGVVMGSDSDFLVMEETLNILVYFDILYEVKVSSAHRTLERTLNWVRQFEDQGGKLIIAAAGLAAHLPGVIAGATILPVIGVPMRGGALEGVDALYSIVQMPPGIPVATVGIGAARNAGILAAQILAQDDQSLRQRLKNHRMKMAAEIEAKDGVIQDKLKKKL
ncbi:MAG: 5-(carboxyamino)imidazole ribonucleotide mutase [Desulfitobacteriaceae bacterium]|nr:5-(carboxyamino)imidazole ribonucleotide mutase [Desulfitobacteriaceae bacterium]MDD4346209.1 5-(carboxyamino)imidazole ribonucleotide mutase [Desulfitobacteriaceae bacterium]MDD4400855.1 5-(carboxyamino)imidazole ribonucleotide mutase [Desulfitobacteriaceae bacterium]